MEDINQILESLNFSLNEVTPIKGENNKYYYTYVVIPTCKNSSFYHKLYFGMRITYSLKTDNYAGSGRKITNYHQKYPGQYYKKYLAFYNNADELCKAEYELIHPHLNKDYCLNLKEGGGNAPLSEETKKKISEKLTGIPLNREQWNKGKHGYLSDESRKKFSERAKGKNNPMYGKNYMDYMSEEAKIEKSKKQSKAMSGKNNPMYGIHSEDLMTEEAIKEKRRKQSKHMGGRKYMHRGQELIYIKPEDIEYYKSIGYILGRKR